MPITTAGHKATGRGGPFSYNYPSKLPIYAIFSHKLSRLKLNSHNKAMNRDCSFLLKLQGKIMKIMKKITVALFLGFMGLGPALHPASQNLSPILSSSTSITACECTFCTNDDAENNRHNMQHIHFAAWEGYLETVKSLIAQEPTLVNVRDYRGMTPLLFAARAGNYDMVELLLETGADYRAYDGNQSTQTPGGNALHHLFYGLEPSNELEYTTTIDDIYDLLIEAGTSPYLEDLNGNTPTDVYNNFLYDNKLNDSDSEDSEEPEEDLSEDNLTNFDLDFDVNLAKAKPITAYPKTREFNHLITYAHQSFAECSPTEIMSNAPTTKVNTAPRAHQSVTECSPTEIMSHQRQEQPFIPHLIFEGLTPELDSIGSYSYGSNQSLSFHDNNDSIYSYDSGDERIENNGSDQSLSFYDNNDSIYSYDSDDERIENNDSDKENISSYTSSSS